jgi:hypothetical protein
MYKIDNDIVYIMGVIDGRRCNIEKNNNTRK